MSAETIPAEVVDQVADIIDQNVLGYSITLTRLVDGIETWTLAMDGETHEFDFREDAAEVVATKRRRLQAARVIEATAAILATRPAEPAAPVAEAGDGEVVGWFCLDLVAGGVKGFTFSESLAKQRDGYRYLGQLAWEVYPVVRLSALEAERARADAAEQRAADALARAEKAAEDERDRLFAKIMEEGPFMRPEHDQGIRQFLQSERATMPADRAAARAAREAQPATDGGEA